MRSKIFSALILSAMLLTACQKQELDTVTEQTAEQTAATSQAETEAPETTTTTTVTTSEAVAETTTTAAETVPPKIENIGGDVTLDIEVKKLDNFYKADRNIARLIFFGDVAAISSYGGSDSRIFFLDIDSETVKAEITLPDDWEFAWYYTYTKGSGDVLCRIKVLRYDYEKYENEYGVLVVRNDFSFEIIEDEPEKSLAVPVGSHNISDIPYNIYDADSGEIIVEGFFDAETELVFASKWFDYKFPIDAERFVYRICGFECKPGFGYYDFAAGKAVNFPNSVDFTPVGVHDGKIYAEQSPWDGECQGELYTFDIETLEKKHFMSSPAEADSEEDFRGYVTYAMPESGRYLAAERFNAMSGTTEFYIISPDSGEVLAKCTLNTLDINSEIKFIGENKFAVYDVENNEIIIFDVTI